jgi:hypothetical protein
MFFWPRQPLNHFYIVDNLCQWWGCRHSSLQEEKTYAHVSSVNRTLQIPLALKHSTTGSFGNSTPGLKLEYTEQFAENILGLGLQWQGGP